VPIDPEKLEEYRRLAKETAVEDITRLGQADAFRMSVVGPGAASADRGFWREAVPTLIAEVERLQNAPVKVYARHDEALTEVSKCALLWQERARKAEAEVERLTRELCEMQEERDKANRCNRVASLAEEHALAEVERLRSLLREVDEALAAGRITPCGGPGHGIDPGIECNGCRLRCRLAAALPGLPLDPTAGAVMPIAPEKIKRWRELPIIPVGPGETVTLPRELCAEAAEAVLALADEVERLWRVEATARTYEALFREGEGLGGKYQLHPSKAQIDEWKRRADVAMDDLRESLGLPRDTVR
jgi:hypothetical protein